MAENKRGEYILDARKRCPIPLHAAMTAVKTWSKNWLWKLQERAVQGSQTGILERAMQRKVSTAKISRDNDLDPAQLFVLLKLRTETYNGAYTSFSLNHETALCSHCSAGPQTAEHFIFECATFQELRMSIFGKASIEKEVERAALWNAGNE